MTLLSFCLLSRHAGNHAVRDNRIPGAGHGRRREGAHPLHQTGPAGRHGAGRHVDDAQARAGLAEDLEQTGQAGGRGHGRGKTAGNLEEIHPGRGECTFTR